MIVLHSHLHPLPFQYLTPLSNPWTWLALLAAALSFWKIRASAPSPKSPPPQSPPPPPPPSLIPQHPPSQSFDAIIRGKFTAYYISDDTDNDSHSHCQCESLEYEELADTSSSSSSSEWWESWDKLLKMRMGESKSGWYAYQDLTELNGNVVRLWDAHAFHTSTSSILLH